MQSSKSAVFTICAQNYFGLAKVLQDSLRTFDSDISFYIFIADMPDHKSDDCVLSAFTLASEMLGEKKFLEIAFKYNLTEFCTFLKPLCFQYLFKSFNFEKVIYLDPDIFLFSSIKSLIADLDYHWISLTPHIIEPSLAEGPRLDRQLMNTGSFNLGYLGLRNSEECSSFLRWWNSRLENQCFIDDYEGLFTDQKWLDLVTSIYDASGISILRHPGVNLAPWNFHEREVVIQDNTDDLFVRIRSSHSLDESQRVRQIYPLIFIHFSGFSYISLAKGELFQSNIENLSIPSDIIPAIRLYSEALQANYDMLKIHMDIKYTFGFFDNKVYINGVYRRIYRALILENFELGNPFVAGNLSFYGLLRSSRLLIGGREGSALSFDKINMRNMPNINRRIYLIRIIMSFVKALIGAKKYFLLVKYFRFFSRMESQIFLVKGNFPEIPG